MADRIKLFLCDDHVLFRQGMKKLLGSEKGIEVVGEADTGADMLRRLKKTNPHIILMDVCMPEMDGIAATYQVKKRFAHIEVIVLTVYEDESHILESIRAGAKGYLVKDASVNELLDAVRIVHRGEAVIQPPIITKLLKGLTMTGKAKSKVKGSGQDRLTEREEEILRLIALGGTNKDIAGRLGIAEKTVKNHISNIFQAINVNNRTKAALYALRRDIGVNMARGHMGLKA